MYFDTYEITNHVISRILRSHFTITTYQGTDVKVFFISNKSQGLAELSFVNVL